MAARGSGWAVWVIVLALVAAACGGDDGGGGGGDGGRATAPATEEQSAADGTAASEQATGGAGRSDGTETYVVRSGDTLSAIANRFDTTVEALVEANDIADPDAIDIGQELTIP